MAFNSSNNGKSFNKKNKFFKKNESNKNTNNVSLSDNIDVDIEEIEGDYVPGNKPVIDLLTMNPEKIDAVFLRKGRHGADFNLIMDLCKDNGIKVSILDSSSFVKIYSGNSQGVLARVFKKGYVPYEDLLTNIISAPLPLLVVLDRIQDAGNVGTLMRTLYCLGAAGLVIPKHNGVYLGSLASKAATGTTQLLPVAKVANISKALDLARDSGIYVYGAASSVSNHNLETAGKKNSSPVVSSVLVSKPKIPAILVLGSESSGIRPGIEKRCNELIHIPMLRDFDSLNVAQAGAILVYWFTTAFNK